MTTIEKIKYIIKSNKYIENILGIYYNYLLYDKKLTRIDFGNYSYSKKILCYICFYKKQICNKNLRIIIFFK